MKEVIIHNRARCATCNQVIESKSVHDFVSCRGGHISVDGGRDYLRRCFDKKENLIECSEVEYLSLDKWLSKRLLAHLTSGTDWKKAIPEMIRGALAYEAVFHLRRALDKIPELHALPFEVREKIEKTIQMEFIGENR